MASEVVERAVNQIDDVLGLATGLLQGLLKQYVGEVSKIYSEFVDELERGVLDIDEYAKTAEDLENRLWIDAEYAARALERLIRGLRREDVEKIQRIIDEDLVYSISILPVLLVRAGCRAGRRDVVVLGIALRYAMGGYVKEALCYSLASIAIAHGRDEVARALAERCMEIDLELKLRRECGVARVIEEYRLDEILTGLSDAVLEMRKIERGE